MPLSPVNRPISYVSDPTLGVNSLRAGYSTPGYNPLADAITGGMQGYNDQIKANQMAEESQALNSYRKYQVASQSLALEKNKQSMLANAAQLEFQAAYQNGTRTGNYSDAYKLIESNPYVQGQFFSSEKGSLFGQVASNSKFVANAPQWLNNSMTTFAAASAKGELALSGENSIAGLLEAAAGERTGRALAGMQTASLVDKGGAPGFLKAREVLGGNAAIAGSISFKPIEINNGTGNIAAGYKFNTIDSKGTQRELALEDSKDNQVLIQVLANISNIRDSTRSSIAEIDNSLNRREQAFAANNLDKNTGESNDNVEEGVSTAPATVMGRAIEDYSNSNDPAVLDKAFNSISSEKGRTSAAKELVFDKRTWGTDAHFQAVSIISQSKDIRDAQIAQDFLPNRVPTLIKSALENIPKDKLDDKALVGAEIAAAISSDKTVSSIASNEDAARYISSQVLSQLGEGGLSNQTSDVGVKALMAIPGFDGSVMAKLMGKSERTSVAEVSKANNEIYLKERDSQLANAKDPISRLDAGLNLVQSNAYYNLTATNQENALKDVYSKSQLAFDELKKDPNIPKEQLDTYASKLDAITPESVLKQKDRISNQQQLEWLRAFKERELSLKEQETASKAETRADRTDIAKQSATASERNINSQIETRTAGIDLAERRLSLAQDRFNLAQENAADSKGLRGEQLGIAKEKLSLAREELDAAKKNIDSQIKTRDDRTFIAGQRLKQGLDIDNKQFGKAIYYLEKTHAFSKYSPSEIINLPKVRPITKEAYLSKLPKNSLERRNSQLLSLPDNEIIGYELPQGNNVRREFSITTENKTTGSGYSRQITNEGIKRQNSPGFKDLDALYQFQNFIFEDDGTTPQPPKNNIKNDEEIVPTTKRLAGGL